MTRLIAFFLVIFSHQVFATPSVNDFAYRAELTNAQQRLQRVELPVDVLLNLTSSGLSDIAVFDANGKTLPHSVLVVLRAKVKKQIDLDFHIFDSFLKQHSKIVTRRQQNQQDGQLSELQTTETIETQQLRQDYLIELPDNPVVADIELEWQQEPKNQLLQIKVEVGTDLDNMRTIDKQKVLSNVNPEAPEWRFIRKIPKGEKYLRITAADNINRFELQKVTAHYQEMEPERKLWQSIEVSPVVIDYKQYLSFNPPSNLIAKAIRIIPGESHRMVQGSLFASNSDFKNKRRIRSGFRQHNIEGEEIKPSQAISLPNRHYQHWWLSLEQPDINPAVELAYPVHEVIFLGNENEPFTIAWGNHQIKGRTGNLAEMMNGDFAQADKRGVVVNMKNIELSGGIVRLSPEAEYAWKTWLLWALLIIAVLVTGRMAYALYRDMNR